MKILVTGGTGFLGTELVDELLRKGHKPIVSTRSPQKMLGEAAQYIKWPLDKSEIKDILPEIDACIHLAGEPIAGKRWTPEQKQKIYESRIGGTREVVDALSLAAKLKVFLSGSAVGIYGNRHDEELNEQSSVGNDFLAEVCKDWEDEALQLKRSDVRTVLLRTGLVLGRAHGLLSELEPLFHNGVAGPLGSGEQYMSWIHVKDWVNATIYALENDSISGPMNLTAPNPVTNKSFTYTMGRVFNQKFFPPAPAPALKIALGEMSDMLLHGQNVIPKKLLSTDFRFKHTDLLAALNDVFETEKHPVVCDFHSSRQFINAPIEKVFDFFSRAENLEVITPPLLNFKVLQKSTEEVQQGTLIDYKLKIHGIPTKWRTLIDEWHPTSRFVDTQLKGPYKKWHHTHTFERLANGTLMKDRVHYKLPMGFLGRTFGLWLVKKDVDNIFSYREKKIRELFS